MKYRAVHSLHTPCSYTEPRRLSNLTSSLPLFTFAAGFCWGCVKLCWRTLMQRCCSQWHCCSPPRYCCNFFFFPTAAPEHFHTFSKMSSHPVSPRLFFLSQWIIPLAPLIKSHAKAQCHFEMLAFSLKFIIGLHHTVISSSIAGTAEDHSV